MGRYQSGQLGQTVNLLSYDFTGSNPVLPTHCGRNSTGRVSAFQAECCEFEPRRPLYEVCEQAAIAQSVERIHGKDEVIGSNPISGSYTIFPKHNKAKKK